MMIDRDKAIKAVTDTLKGLADVSGNEVIRCSECKHKYMKSMGYYCSERVHPLNPEGYCERGERE